MIQPKNKTSFISMLSYSPVVILPVLFLSQFLFSERAFYWGIPELQLIPWRVYAFEWFQRGVFPFWNALNGMGAPLAANYQLAFFYPPTWILYLAYLLGGAPWLAWTHQVVLVLHLVWAGIGMILLLRELGVRRLGQTIAGLTFSLGGFVSARMGFYNMVWTAAWMPWLVWLSKDIAIPVFQRRSIGIGSRTWLLAGAVAMMLLAGHAQFSWYIFLFLYAWIFIGGWLESGFRGALRSVLLLSIPVMVGVLIAGVQLIPTAEYLLQSQRAISVDYETMVAYSFWPWHFITLFAPGFFGNPGLGTYWGFGNSWEDAIYIGVLPFLMGVSTLRKLFVNRYSHATEWIRPILGLVWTFVVLGFLLGLGSNTPIFPFLAQHVPTFSMFHAPARFLIWSAFGLSLLAGIGVQQWKAPSGRGLYWMRLGTAGAGAVTLGAFLAWYFLREVNTTFIQATALAGVWGVGTGLLTLFMPDEERKPKAYIVWSGIVMLWVSADLLVAGWWNNPAIPIDFYQTGTPLAKVQTDSHRYFMDSKVEYQLKFNRFLRFDDFRPIENPRQIFSALVPNINLLENIPSANNFDPLLPGRYSDWIKKVELLPQDQQKNFLELMDVSVIVKPDYQNNTGVTFDYLDGADRARWFACAEMVDGEANEMTRVVEMAKDGSLLSNSSRLIIEKSPGFQKENCKRSGWAEVTARQSRPDEIIIETNQQDAGWVFLADTWYPGWQVRIDGQSGKVFRANYLFMAAQVPAGEHTVVFKYNPSIYTIGMAASLVGWLIVIASVIISKDKTGPQKEILISK
jgi:hypothetical protein